MSRGTQICQGYTAKGTKCRKPLGKDNTTGYCRDSHRSAHQKIIKSGGATPASEMASQIGNKTMRGDTIRMGEPSEQGVATGSMYSHFSPELFPELDRTVIPQGDSKNWANPEVQDIASRFAIMDFQKKKNNKMISSMSSIVNARVENELKKMGKDEGTITIKDSMGRDAGSVTRQWRDGNFSEKAYIGNLKDAKNRIPLENLSDYQEKKLDADEFKKHYPKDYDSLRTTGKPGFKSEIAGEGVEALEDRYLERYDGKQIDPDSLKNWKTSALTHEIMRMRTENQNLDAIMNRDKDDLLYALPYDTYQGHNEDNGLDTDLTLTEPGKTFSAASYSNLPEDRKEEIAYDPRVWKSSYTSKSMKSGDKKHNTNFFDSGKNDGSYKMTISE